MAVYVVAQLDVKNTNWQQEYGPQARAFLQKHGGKVIVGPGYTIERLEGRKPLPNKPGQHLRYIIAEISRLCQPHVSPSISMFDLSRVGGLVLPLRGMVAHRDDVYRVQSI
jgi:hypothetical protein